MKSDVEIAAAEILKERTGGLYLPRVAEVLARDIIDRDTFVHEPDEAVEAGVLAAIKEIDDATFDAAFNVIQKQVSDEVEGQAKAIALRMLRELAAKAEREEVAAVG
jgi:hypothetical protein